MYRDRYKNPLARMPNLSDFQTARKKVRRLLTRFNYIQIVTLRVIFDF